MTVQAVRKSFTVSVIFSNYSSELLCKNSTVNMTIFTKQNFVIYGIIKFQSNYDFLFLSYNDKYLLQ